MFRLFNPFSSITHCFHLGPYFAEDDGKGGGGGGGGDDDADDDDEDDADDDAGKEKTLTQAEANKLIGKARAKGGQSAVSKLLVTLGVTTEAELKTLIATAKDAGKAGKTELEKLQADLEAEKTKAETVKADAEKKSAATTERLLRAAIKDAAIKATMDDKSKKVLRAAFKNDPGVLDDIYTRIDRKLITLPEDDDPESDFQGIEKALAKLAKERPHWLDDASTQTKARGTGNGPGGRLQDLTKGKDKDGNAERPAPRRIKGF